MKEKILKVLITVACLILASLLMAIWGITYPFWWIHERIEIKY